MADGRVGADAFIEQLVAAGVRWIFGNPGTTEQPLLRRLSGHPELGFILALHEAVAVGAAEGYARASRRVGVVELHAGPGLGNGIGMLYNAKAGQTPLVVYVGQVEQRGLHSEPTLGGDLVAMATPVSKWAHQVQTADEIPQIVRRALKVAATPPRGPVVLAIPMDLMEAACGAPALEPSYVPPAWPDPDAVAKAAAVVAAAEAPVVLVGDGVAESGALAEVGDLAEAIGAPVYGASMNEVCMAPDHPLNAGRLPSIDGAAAGRALDGYDVVVAVGTKVFAHIFPTAGLPLGDRPVVHIGLDPWELAKNQPSTVVFGDEKATLRSLVDVVGASVPPDRREVIATRRCRVATTVSQTRERALAADRARWDDVPMSPERAVAELAAALPADVRVVDESLTAYGAVSRYIRLDAGRWFRLRGGGIGEGMPMPVGVQLAHPDDRVVAIVGDGSAMYTVSAMWTAAHHGLPVVWVILNNRSYRVLKENARFGAAPGAPAEVTATDLVHPELDFVALARGMGVDAQRVADPAEIGPALTHALATNRPALLDLSINGDPAAS